MAVYINKNSLIAEWNPSLISKNWKDWIDTESTRFTLSVGILRQTEKGYNVQL